MARAVAAFGSSEVSGMVGKLEYKLGRNGQLIGERSRARNKRTAAQYDARNFFALTARAWSQLDTEYRDAWSSAVEPNDKARLAFNRAFTLGCKYYNISPVDMLASVDFYLFPFLDVKDPCPWDSLLITVNHSNRDLVYFNLGAMPEALTVMSVSYANGTSTRGLPDSRKFRFRAVLDSYADGYVQFDRNSQDVLWLKLEYCTMYAFSLIQTRYLKIEGTSVVGYV